MLYWCVWHHWDPMSTFIVICFTSALATTACVSLEWAVPVAVFLYIRDHILLLIVAAKAVLTELFPINCLNTCGHLRACADLVVFVADEDETALLAEVAESNLIDDFSLVLGDNLLGPIQLVQEPLVELGL